MVFFSVVVVLFVWLLKVASSFHHICFYYFASTMPTFLFLFLHTLYRPSMNETFREDCTLNDRANATIVCDGAGHVVKLSINDRELSGLLPTSLALLTELRHLSLYANKLTGTMGDASGSLFSSLTKLTHLGTLLR
jgi:hypothetical protein